MSDFQFDDAGGGDPAEFDAASEPPPEVPEQAVPQSGEDVIFIPEGEAQSQDSLEIERVNPE